MKSPCSRYVSVSVSISPVIRKIRLMRLPCCLCIPLSFSLIVLLVLCQSKVGNYLLTELLVLVLIQVLKMNRYTCRSSE
jgi:hypothetical protein